MTDAIDALLKADLWVNHPKWDHIIWDPVERRMLKRHNNAETYLLKQIGERGRTSKSEASLDEVIRNRTRR